MPDSPPATTTEVARLFWAARKEHRQEKQAGPAHSEAIAYSRQRALDWMANLLEASRLEAADEPQDALALLARCEDSIPENARGLWHFLRGSALRGKGKMDDAIAAFRRALDTPGYDTSGYVLYNLGNALLDKGDLDEAIDAYRKALDTPGFDLPGYAWNNLGNAFQAKGKLDEAIDAHRKALDTPGYDTPAYAWANLGNALRDMGELDKAIDAYRKALDTPGFDNPGGAWNNLGIALQAKGELDEAIAAYRKALDAPGFEEKAKTWANLGRLYLDRGDFTAAEDAYEEVLARSQEGDPVRASARLWRSILESRLRPEALTSDDRAFIEKPASETFIEKPASETGIGSIEARLIEKIQLAGETQYDRYVGKSDSGRGDSLSVLRGWSSSVTLLEGSERRWRGGGYFLKWGGFGVVLDPGIDFLRNFHDAGFHGREISGVIVSHNHPDHNEDLKPIDDLRYELYKRLAGKEGAELGPYLLIWDEDTARATQFATQKPAHQLEPIIMPVGFPQPINLSQHPRVRIPLRLTPFKVRHSFDVPAAMGMTIELLDNVGKSVLRLGYTADTGYFEELCGHLEGATF